MGAKWSTVSTATYADGSPADDGSATAANRVKYATIMSDLTNPLDTAIDSIVAKLDQRFNEATTSKSTDYTTVASDHAKILQVSSGAISLLAAATAGAGYRVGVYANGADITVNTTTVVSDGSLVWFTVNAAGNGYITDATPNHSPILHTDITTTSGSSATYSSIPSWVRKITFMLRDFSTDGGNTCYFQLGEASGGMATTGYLGAAFTYADGVLPTVSAETQGFGLLVSTLDARINGSIIITLENVSGAIWTAHGTFGRSDSGGRILGCGGSINLAGVMDRCRLVTSGGDLFDRGQVNILLE